MSQPFQPIPHSLLESGWRGHVHVEGWNPACVFIFDGIGGTGEYRLRTPKTCRRYNTNSRLLFTRGNQISFATTPPATPTSRSQPDATIGPRKRRADALTDAACHATGLEIDHQSPALLASNTPRPGQTVEQPARNDKGRSALTRQGR